MRVFTCIFRILVYTLYCKFCISICTVLPAGDWMYINTSISTSLWSTHCQRVELKKIWQFWWFKRFLKTIFQPLLVW